MPSDSLTGRDKGRYLGKVPWSLNWEGWWSQWFIFITNTLWVKVFAGDRLSDRHGLAQRLRIIRSHWDGSPIMQPWYYLQKRISDGAKYPPSPHLKLSHKGGCGELVQDPRIQTAVWMELMLSSSRSAVLHVCSVLLRQSGALRNKYAVCGWWSATKQFRI